MGQLAHEGGLLTQESSFPTLTPKFRKTLEGQVIPPSSHSGGAELEAMFQKLACCAAPPQGESAHRPLGGGRQSSERTTLAALSLLTQAREERTCGINTNPPLLVMDD